MLLALLKFYCHVLMQSSVSHYFHADLVVDSKHSHYRRLTEHYRKKRDVVKNFWIVAGLVMLVYPQLYAIVSIALFTTFISFMVLDELNEG